MENEFYQAVEKAKKYDNLIKMQNMFEVLSCSFCGKKQDDVKHLVAGVNVYICDKCVALCVEILDEIN